MVLRHDDQGPQSRLVPVVLRRRCRRWCVSVLPKLLIHRSLTPRRRSLTPTVVQAKALYSYTGSSDQELPFVEGDILTIVEHTDDSWWKAVSDGIVFLVPAAYLDLQG